jgi:hypothetical protein
VPQAVAAGAIKTFFVKLIIAIAVNVIVNKVTKAMQKRPVRQLQKVDVSYSGGLAAATHPLRELSRRWARADAGIRVGLQRREAE